MGLRSGLYGGKNLTKAPDLNPIEEVFAKVKSYLKANEVAYDVTSSPNLLITMGFCTVSSDDCIGYIQHAGYDTH